MLKLSKGKKLSYRKKKKSERHNDARKERRVRSKSPCAPSLMMMSHDCITRGREGRREEKRAKKQNTGRRRGVPSEKNVKKM